MPNFNVTIWRSKRMEQAEGSGVAAAIKSFNSVWPAKAADFDDKSLQQASKAVVAFETALGTAKGKCEKAKKADPKGYKATTDLIDDWAQELKGCHAVLTEAAARVQKLADEQAEAREAAENHAQMRKKMLAEVESSFKGTADTIKNTNGDLVELKKAIKAGDLDLCYKKQGNISKSLRGLPFNWSDAGVKQKIGYAQTKLNCTDDNIVSIKECKPKDAPKWKKIVVELGKTLEEFEQEMDELEKKVEVPDPGGASGTPEYKANLAGFVADYREIYGVIRSVSAKVNTLATNTNQLEVAKAKLPPDKQAAVASIRDKLVRQLREALDEMEAALQRTRNKNGDVGKRKDDLKKAGKGVTEADDIKYLAPLLDRSYSLNLRVLKSIVASEETIRDLFAT